MIRIRMVWAQLGGTGTGAVWDGDDSMSDLLPHKEDLPVLLKAWKRGVLG